MIYNLTTVDTVINKIIRDLGLGQEEIPHLDFIEWIAEALSHIGSYNQFVEKEAHIVIENYEGLLPCDLWQVIRLKRGLEIKPDGSGGYYGGSLQGLLANIGVEWESIPAYERFNIVNTAGLSRIDASTNPLDAISNRLQYNGNLIGNPVSNSHTGLDFNINFNRVTTSFHTGVIELQYMAMPVDDRGWPLVPDDPSFSDAMFWKCAMQLSMRSPDLLKNRQLQDYAYCRSKWNFYCVQARANATMPDMAGMERLKNQYLNLYNRLDRDLGDYQSLGKPQILNLNGRR